MTLKLLGLAVLLSLIHASVQLRCYSCQSSVIQDTPTSSPPTPQMQPTASRDINNDCGSVLNDTLLVDCEGDCAKYVVQFVLVNTTYRTCAKSDHCTAVNGSVGDTGGKLVECRTCSKDRCNSASNFVMSSFLIFGAAFVALLKLNQL